MIATGSLCTGYAGLDLAVHAVFGGELAWAADNDPGAAKILAHRFPGVPNLGDITAVEWTTVTPVDILTAGFPCTDVSCAGLRAGLRAGTRSGVWTHVAGAIRALRPQLVFLENVRGLFSAGADSAVEQCPWCLGEGGSEHPLRALGAVLGDLSDLGYVGRYRLVSAAAAGAPHRRERVFILAWPAAHADGAGEGRPEQPARGHDPGRRSSGGDPVPADAERDGREGRQRPGRPHEGGTPPHGGGRGPAGGGRAAENADRATGGQRGLAASGQAPGGRSRADAGGSGGAPAPAYARGDEPGRDDAIPGDGPRDEGIGPRAGGRLPAAADAQGDGRHEGGAEPAGIVGGSDAALSGHGTAPHAERSGLGGRAPDTGRRPVIGDAARRDRGTAGGRTLDWGPYGPAIARWERALGRSAPRPTEPGRTGERLSPRFVEWMMGLPGGWVTDVPGLSRNAQLKALGNGVVPAQAELALRLLLERAGFTEAGEAA